MNDSWFHEGNFNIFPEEIFDVLNFCDLPLEDVETHDDKEDWQAEFEDIEPPPLNVLESLSSSLCTEDNNDDLEGGKKSAIVSYDKWRSSSDAKTTIPLCDSSEEKYVQMLWTCSPVSVLESEQKCIVPAKRPRSKRCCTPRRIIHPVAFPCSSKRYQHLAAPALDGESHQGEMPSNFAMNRLMKENLTRLSHEEETAESLVEPVETRRCTHCQVTQTPQWREGPLGPKTLCNACGVRYRSGRLFPEYRPAASPTFVPSLHSNSHRKVLEMRKKAD